MFAWLNSDSREALRALRALEAIKELSSGDGESVEVYKDRVRVCGAWTCWVSVSYNKFPSAYEALMAAQRDRRRFLTNHHTEV